MRYLVDEMPHEPIDCPFANQSYTKTNTSAPKQAVYVVASQSVRSRSKLRIPVTVLFPYPD